MKLVVGLLFGLLSQGLFANDVHKDGWIVGDIFVSGTACGTNTAADIELSTFKNTTPEGKNECKLQIALSFDDFKTTLLSGDSFASETCNISLVVKQAPCKWVKLDRAIWSGSGFLAADTSGLASVNFFTDNSPVLGDDWSKVGPIMPPEDIKLIVEDIGTEQAGFVINAEAQTLIAGDMGFIQLNRFSDESIAYSCSCECE